MSEPELSQPATLVRHRVGGAHRDSVEDASVGPAQSDRPVATVRCRAEHRVGVALAQELAAACQEVGRSPAACPCRPAVPGRRPRRTRRQAGRPTFRSPVGSPSPPAAAMIRSGRRARAPSRAPGVATTVSSVSRRAAAAIAAASAWLQRWAQASLDPAGHRLLGDHDDRRRAHAADPAPCRATVRRVPRTVPVTFERPTRGRYETVDLVDPPAAARRPQHHLEGPAEAAVAACPSVQQVGAPHRPHRSEVRQPSARPGDAAPRRRARGSRIARGAATRRARPVAAAEHEVGAAVGDRRRRPRGDRRGSSDAVAVHEAHDVGSARRQPGVARGAEARGRAPSTTLAPSAARDLRPSRRSSRCRRRWVGSRGRGASTPAATPRLRRAPGARHRSPSERTHGTPRCRRHRAYKIRNSRSLREAKLSRHGATA